MSNTVRSRVRSVSILFVVVVALPARSDEAWFQLFYPDGGHLSVLAISADGSTAAGWDQGNYYWNRDEGLVDTGKDGFVRGVSADGALLVGVAGTAGVARWDRDTGWMNLGLPKGYDYGDTRGSSDDARTIVGGCWRTNEYDRPVFRWREDVGFEIIGLWRDARTDSQGVSGDGNVIFGRATPNEHGQPGGPWRWTDADGFRGLELIDEDKSDGTATASSFDGRIIVGQCTDSQRVPQAVRWVDGRVEILYGADGGDDYLEATDVSADGRVVVGHKEAAWVWTATRAARPLADVLSHDWGLEVEGLTLSHPRVSGDGLTFAGTVANNEYGWVAHIPARCAGQRGDLNCDQSVDFDDIDPFVAAVVSLADYRAQFPDCDACAADINRDYAIDFNDIDGFVDCLTNGGCE